MKPNTCLVVDVWEGQLEIDEAVLKANGVAGIGIRINDINGGHHLDTGFAKQWGESAGFVRFPYFVYNPWETGQANFDWLAANLPTGQKSVAIDIEVRKPGYSASSYAGEVNRFLDLCKLRSWRTILYTGQWFLSALSKWPVVDYWWAQYPDPALHFAGVKTWADLKLRLDGLSLPLNLKSIPGTLKMWQFSGDYLILPGNPRDVDVNLFYGTPAELAAYFDSPAPVEIPPVKPPRPALALPGLFTFSCASYLQHAAGAPLVSPYYSLPEVSADRASVLLNDAWNKYLRGTNSSKAYTRIITKDWGPSRGLNDKGLLELKTLVYPGRNLVRILKTTTDSAGVVWGQLETLSSVRTPAATINYIDTPHLVHRLYTRNGNLTWSLLTDAPLVPLVSDSQAWIRMEWLEPISAQLPKIVQVKSQQGMNVRTKPDMNAPKFKVLYHGQTIQVQSLEIGNGGIWGHTSQGWIALRYKDLNLTDWQI